MADMQWSFEVERSLHDERLGGRVGKYWCFTRPGSDDESWFVKLHSEHHLPSTPGFAGAHEGPFRTERAARSQLLKWHRELLAQLPREGR